MAKNINYLLMLVLVFGFALGPVIPAEGKVGTQEKWRLSSATDVKIGKKTTIESPKGKPADLSPSASKKAKPEAALVSGVLGEPLADTAQKYAIVVGVSDYPGEANDIFAYDADGLNMRNVLVDVYGYPAQNVFLFQDMGAVFSEITAKIAYLQEVVLPGDEVVFFHSGHGATGYANDGDRERLDEAIVWHNGDSLVPVWDGDLKLWLSQINIQRIVTIFDSCYSGGMNDVSAESQLFVSASQEKELAWTYYQTAEGMFSHFFVNEAMALGWADLSDHNADQILGQNSDATLEEAFEYAVGKITVSAPQITDAYAGDLLLGYSN